MKTLIRLLLTLNSTSWVIVVYGIKEKWTVSNIPFWIFGIVLLTIPIIFSFISLLLFNAMSKDELSGCTEIKPANLEFLAVYLGYVFVGLGVDELSTLLFVYAIINLLSFASYSQYYNPLFLLFGYKYYYITTSTGSNVFLITKMNIRNSKDVHFDNLRRINDTTYIAKENKKS